jgi:hypothetical protein
LQPDRDHEGSVPPENVRDLSESERRNQCSHAVEAKQQLRGAASEKWVIRVGLVAELDDLLRPAIEAN